MEVAMRLDESIARKKLAQIEEPKNVILARLQSCLTSENNRKTVAGYSRMHSRHNRS